MTRDRLERIGALALLAFSLAYLLGAFSIRLTPASDDSPLSARSLPFALGVLGMILSAVLVVKPPASADVEPGGAPLAWRRAGGLIALMALYAALIAPLGFVVTSALFLAGGFAVLGERRWLLLAVVAVVTAVVFWAAFRLLDVNLDWGVFERILR